MGRDFSKTVFSSEFFIPVSCDVNNISDLQSKIQNIRSKEEVSVLINNAGIGYFGPHEEQNPHKIHQMVVTNLEVPMILTQVLLRDLKKMQVIL